MQKSLCKCRIWQSLGPSFERNGNGVTIWRERKKPNKASFKRADWLEFPSVQRTLIFWFGYNQTGFKWEWDALPPVSLSLSLWQLWMCGNRDVGEASEVVTSYQSVAFKRCCSLFLSPLFGLNVLWKTTSCETPLLQNCSPKNSPDLQFCRNGWSLINKDRCFSESRIMFTVVI